MARLTNADRDQIVSVMKPEIFLKVRKLKESMSVLLNEFIEETIPSEVTAFTLKYPRLVLTTDTIYYYARNASVSLSCIKHPSNYFPKIIESVKKWKKGDEFSVLMKELEIELEKASIMVKKLKCILDDVSTTKKLQDEFPEAYAALFSPQESPASSKSSNSCDSIENIRAELSNLKK